jgi:hypothetical protein
MVVVAAAVGQWGQERLQKKTVWWRRMEMVVVPRCRMEMMVVVSRMCQVAAVVVRAG